MNRSNVLRLLFVIVAMRGFFTVTIAANTDSLAYRTLRKQMALTDSANLALPTADALAEAGLFTDALSILKEYNVPGDTIRAVTSNSVPEDSLPVRWTISSGIAYNHLEDIDTIAMTPQELTDYQRLTDTPMEVWFRAKASIYPNLPGFDELTPQGSVSKRKGRLETSARLTLPGGAVRIEPSIKGEKWFESTSTVGNRQDSLSKKPLTMAGGSCRIHFVNRAPPNATLNFALPLYVEGEYYKNSRPAYESFVKYSMLPEIELSTESSMLRCQIAGEVRYEDYLRRQADENDVLRLLSRLEGSIRSSKGSINTSATWMGDRYTSSDKLAIDRIEGDVRGRYILMGLLNAHLLVRGVFEKEMHKKFLNSAAYSLTGKQITTRPGIEIALIREQLHIEPELLWEYRWAKKYADCFLWEARNIVEPGVRVTWNHKIINSSINAAFRYENISNEFESYIADSRSFHGGAEVSVAPTSFISTNVILDYQYRKYTPFTINARVSENITVSWDIVITW